MQTLPQPAVRSIPRAQHDARAHARLRLAALAGLTGINLITFLGTAWDTQWHLVVGRDSLWIPPHVVTAVSFAGGLAIAVAGLFYEFWLDRAGVPLTGVVRFGRGRASVGFLGLVIGYTFGAFAALIDDAWHRAYGLDVTLWSPPHWLLALAILVIDLSLVLGLASAARSRRQTYHWRGSYFWLFTLAGGISFAIVLGQLMEALIAGHRAQGQGLAGILFPILAGCLFPLPMLLTVKLTGRHWAPLAALTALLGLQYAAMGFAQAGFMILDPATNMDEFVRLEPESAIALTREFARLNGFTGLIGHVQVWAIGLSTVPLGLVALLGWWPWARSRPLTAAMVYSASLVVFAWLVFRTMPGMAAYKTNLFGVAVGALLAVAGGLASGWFGLKLARLAGGPG